MAVVIQDIVIPNQESSAQAWIQYHRALRSRFGSANARTLFIHTFTIRGNTAITTDPEFDMYFTKHEIDVKSGMDNLLIAGREIGEGIDFGFKASLWLLGALALAFLFGLFRTLIFNPEKAVSMLPAGKAMKVKKAIG